MNEGVKILLERMETNPEDFIERDFDPQGNMINGKFRWVGAGIASLIKGEDWSWAVYLKPEEIDALKAAFIELERRNFTAKVMSKLLVEEKEEEQRHGFIAQPVQPVMTLGSSGSLGIGTTSGSNGSFYTANTSGIGTQAKNAVTIAPYASGPSIDFDAKTITALNEMIAKWRGKE